MKKVITGFLTALLLGIAPVVPAQILAGIMAGTPFTCTTYATFDPSNKGAGITLSGVNLVATDTTTNATVISTIGKATGKWYWEITYTTKGGAGNFPAGIAKSTVTLTNFPGFDANGWGWEDNTNKWNSNVSATYGASLAAGDVIGVKLDMDSGTIEMLKNNVSQGTMYSTGITGTMFAAVGFSGAPGGALTANFGASAFTYSVPANYNAGLCN